MEDVYLSLERHEQKMKMIERDLAVLCEVQTEIRNMNETLVMLANELKHANEHLASHERKIEEIRSQPKQRLQQIFSAIVGALCGSLLSAIVGMIVSG